MIARRPSLTPPALLALLIAFLLLLAQPSPAMAHPLGNFTVNQYNRFELMTTGVRLVYVLDLAEIPAFQELARIDTDGNGAVDDGERDAYLDAKLPEIAAALHLVDGDRSVPLRVGERNLAFLPGHAGLKTMRLSATFTPDLAMGGSLPLHLRYRNDYATDRLGWREIVVTHGAGVRLDASDAPTTDRSHELRAYPQDMLTSPLDQTAATFTYSLVPGAAAAAGFGDTATAVTGMRPGADGGRLSAFIADRERSALGLLLAFAAAVGWGALHALSPGHGKTVVGAYLVGARGTARHALVLGLTVTITHTAGVLALGILTLFASRYVVPERLYPWLSLISGLLVAVMGLTILRQRLRGRPALGFHQHHHDAEATGDRHHHDHDHDHVHSHDHDHGHDLDGNAHSHGGHVHSHLPPGADGSTVTWRSLLALGVSGGLLPCPSALLVLLGAIAIGRAGFGLLLVLAFSLGLAGTLTGVGLLFLSAGRFLERRAPAGPWTRVVLRYAPVGGALGVTVAGLAIAMRALAETRLW